MITTSPFGKRSVSFFTTVVLPEPVPPAMPIMNIRMLFVSGYKGNTFFLFSQIMQLFAATSPIKPIRFLISLH